MNAFASRRSQEELVELFWKVVGQARSAGEAKSVSAKLGQYNVSSNHRITRSKNNTLPKSAETCELQLIFHLHSDKRNHRQLHQGSAD
jgi:hypothetical protein